MEFILKMYLPQNTYTLFRLACFGLSRFSQLLNLHSLWRKAMKVNA